MIIFCINKGIKPNSVYLKSKLLESNKIPENLDFNIGILKNVKRVI